MHEHVAKISRQVGEKVRCAAEDDWSDFASAATFEAVTHPEAWSIPMRLAFTLAAAIFVDLLLISWLIG